MTAAELLLLAAPTAPMAVALTAAAAPPAMVRAALALAALPGLAAGLVAAAAAGPLAGTAPGFLFGARLGLDPEMGFPMAAVALVWGAAALHGTASAETGAAARRYAVCFGLAMAGQMATFVARDLASFYAGFAALSFAGYGLVAHRGDAAATRAARVYVRFVVLGELALFAAFALMSAAQDGGLATPAAGAPPPPAFAYWLLAVGFGVKAGLVPLHAWLPLAHPVAPVPASAALSGATLKAGLLGLVLFAPAAAAPPGFGDALLALGLAGGFGGALLAALQRDAKTALAWSSVSQMGLALALWGAACGGHAAPEAAKAAVLLIVAQHALAKAALFLAVDPGMPRRIGLLAALAAALSLTGAPLTLGYAAKSATAAALIAGPLETLFAAAAFGTALAMARALWLMAAKPAEGSGARAAALLLAMAALLAGPALAGLGAVPKDAASAGVAVAPALVALAAAAALARSGARPPGWAAADPLAYAAPLAAAVRGAAAAFAALLSGVERARAAAVGRLSAFGARLTREPATPSEQDAWLGIAAASLAALAAFAAAL